MGIPGLRHEEDDEETSFLQPEPKEEPRDNDQVKQAAQHTILTEPDEERKGQSEVPQSEENKERFTRQEKELTQKSSSSTGEADNRESGANILPPDVVKEQAENEENEEEMKLREIYSMIKDQRNMVMHVQRSQEEVKDNEEEMDPRQLYLMKNPEDFEEGNEMIKDASRDLDFGVQILEGYDGNNRLANGVNGRVTMARSSDQDSKNEDLSFGLWKCLKIL